MAYKYKYNGKEYQDELGLNMYAMDMRQFDPAIARWVVQDPVVHHNYSPYSAFDNNPVFWADPSGADSQTDALGRNRFDTNGFYITPDQRGEANLSIYSSGGGEGDGGNTDFSPTRLAAALMAQDVYGETNENLRGWEDAGNPFELILEDDKSGLLAKLYSMKGRKETHYALVYAGTQEIKKDGVQDLLQVFGSSKQYDLAVANAKKLYLKGVKNLTFIGHSLGGGLAQASALAYGGNAITFNPAWLSDSTVRKHKLKSNARIINYIIAGEILTTTQAIYHSVLKIQPRGHNSFMYWEKIFKSRNGILNAHKIGTVLETIKH